DETYGQSDVQAVPHPGQHQAEPREPGRGNAPALPSRGGRKGWGVGEAGRRHGVGGPAQKSSRRTTLPPVVTFPASVSAYPTPPASCSSGVESVVVRRHDAGSEVPAFHTLARTVVGEVPVTWNRTASFSPGPTLRSGTLTAASVVSE